MAGAGMAGMSDHKSCRRATWSPSANPRSPFTGEWHCYHCGELLAMSSRFSESYIESRLIQAATRVDGLVTFGLPERYRTTSRARIPKKVRFSGPHPLPLAIYCPRPGVCGRVQHLHLDADESAKLA
jgi:hypothetical protein